jgi:hypothetical protein
MNVVFQFTLVLEVAEVVGDVNGVGIRISFLVPLPSWPSRFRPHIYRTPSLVRRAE